MAPFFMKGKEGICCGFCICCPYGCTYLVPAICTFLAIAFTSGASWSCDYMEVTYKEQGIFTSATKSQFSLGPWTIEDFNVSKGEIVSHGDCVAWSNHDTLDEDDIDSALSFARAMIFIVCVPAYFVTLGFAFGACMVLGKFCIYAIALSYLLFGIVFPISLAAFASDFCKDADDCKAGASSFAVIIAFFFWLVGAGFVLTMKERERHDKDATKDKDEEEDEKQDVEEQPLSPTTNVEEEIITEADGTRVKVITTTVINADGTKSVTETREVLTEENEETGQEEEEEDKGNEEEANENEDNDEGGEGDAEGGDADAADDTDKPTTS